LNSKLNHDHQQVGIAGTWRVGVLFSVRGIQMSFQTKPRRRLAAIVFMFASTLISAEPARAQQTVTSATLSGVVQDLSGAFVTDAVLTATNLDTNQKQVAATDHDGHYRFPYLPVGAYRLSVNAPGFSLFAKELTLTVGQALSMPVKLEVAGVSEKVTVTATTPLIETVRTQVTETVRPTEIDRLPLNGRNYLDLALLVPGVSPTNTGTNQRFAETSAVPGQGLSVAGQRNLYNSFIVDGLSANDDAADLTGTYFSEEVIREFQVVTSGGIAEFGRASGGIVNIITKSGTNKWRGDLYDPGVETAFDAHTLCAVREQRRHDHRDAAQCPACRHLRKHPGLHQSGQQLRGEWQRLDGPGCFSVGERDRAHGCPGQRMENCRERRHHRRRRFSWDNGQSSA